MTPALAGHSMPPHMGKYMSQAQSATSSAMTPIHLYESYGVMEPAVKNAACGGKRKCLITQGKPSLGQQLEPTATAVCVLRSHIAACRHCPGCTCHPTAAAQSQSSDGHASQRGRRRCAACAERVKCLPRLCDGAAQVAAGADAAADEPQRAAGDEGHDAVHRAAGALVCDAVIQGVSDQAFCNGPAYVDCGPRRCRRHARFALPRKQ